MTKYKSLGSGNPVRFAQYLAELLVEREARFKGTILPSCYWRNPEYILWSKRLKTQVYGIEKLLKVYSESIILKAFLQNDKIYSAHSVMFQNLIREENRKSQNIETTKIDIIEEVNTVPVKFGKKSRKSKLE